MSTSARLLALLALLQASRVWPGSVLAERLEVSRRTIRRDIERLRDLGYPVAGTMGADGGYRLVAGSAIPPLLLDDDEAVSIVVGLRTVAGNALAGIDEASVRALAKLEQVLPARLRARFRSLAAATTWMTWYEATTDPEVLTAVARAIGADQLLRFVYRAADGSESRRSVEPKGLVVFGRRWYVVGWDEDRADWRISGPIGCRTRGRALGAPPGTISPTARMRRRSFGRASLRGPRCIGWLRRSTRRPSSWRRALAMSPPSWTLSGRIDAD